MRRCRSNTRDAESDRRDQEHRPSVRRRDFRGAAAARRPARRRLARRRDVPAVRGRRCRPDDSQVHPSLHARRPGAARHADAGDRGPTRRLRSRAQQNILISGGTGTGKTTLLNALAAHIPDRDRVIVIEETAEIHLEQAERAAARSAARAGAARTGGAAAGRSRSPTSCGQHFGTGPIASSSARCAAPRHSICCRR